MPTRGSFSSRISSATSRWIWSATRKPRFGIDLLCRMVGVFRGPSSTNPAIFGKAGFGVQTQSALQRSCHFLDFEELQLIAFFDVVVVLQFDAALEARGHFAHVVLEAAHRFD